MQGAMRPLPCSEAGLFMIASNQHGQPSITPECSSGPTLTLPDFYLDLMFGGLPAPGDIQPSPAPARGEQELAVAAT
jgi:hypothetical protein